MNKQSENSYIVVDGEEMPENERKIYFQCLECHKKNGRGYLWLARNGYGAYDILCKECKRLIHDKSNGISLV